MKTYQVNEIFWSLQGEGARIGTPNVFIRFSGCNLSCRADGPEGFDCDTEFVSGRKMTAAEIAREVKDCSSGKAQWVILTGGEPALQIDEDLIATLRLAGLKIAIETNGTCELPEGIDWTCVSPKTAEHTLRVKKCDEVKYVRQIGQAIPRTVLKATHYYISPAWSAGGLSPHTLRYCIELVKDNPQWSLSVQQHKLFGIR